MYSDRNIINRRNVREDPHTAYRPDRDFLILEVTARVVAAAFEVLGMGNKIEQPKNLPIPVEVTTWDNLKKLQFLHKAAAMIVDKLVVDKEMMDETITSMISAQERQEIVNKIEYTQMGVSLVDTLGVQSLSSTMEKAERDMNSVMILQ